MTIARSPEEKSEGLDRESEKRRRTHRVRRALISLLHFWCFMKHPGFKLWHVGTGVLLLFAALGTLLLFGNTRSEAYPGMPEDQRSYWEWISSINQDRKEALQNGIDLLYKYPGLRRLYLRLAEVCVDEQQTVPCAEALKNARIDTPVTRLYRDVALANFLASDSLKSVYLRVASDRALDPGLSRILVDEARSDREHIWTDELESRWEARRDYGALFGKGYASVLRGEWSRAESLLTRVTSIAPDDPEAYRELGRIYYATGRAADLEKVLRRGMTAAVKRNDLEQEIILRGNLGLALFERGALAEASTTFEDALKRSRSIANRKSEGFNLYRLAAVRHRQGRYDEALVLLDSAETRYISYAPRQRSEVQILRGATLRALFRFSDAEQTLEGAIAEAQAAGNVVTQVQGQVSLGQLRLRMGRLEAAREITMQAHDLAHQTRQVEAEIVSLMTLGDIERVLGRYDAAEQLYQKGLTLAQSSQKVMRIQELAGRLGVTALNVQDTRKARQYFDQMLAQGAPSAVTAARASLGLGHTYALYGSYSEAIRYYDRALAKLKAADGDVERDLRISILLAKAGDLTTLGKNSEAERLLHEAHALSRNNESGLYRTEIALGQLAYQQAEYRNALSYLRQADARSFQRPSMHWQLYHTRALCYVKLGKNHDAEMAFRTAIAVVESMRDDLQGSRERSSFVQGKVQVYRDFTQYLNVHGRSDEAFHFLERARSRSLVDLLFTSQLERRLDQRRNADRAIEMSRRLRAIEEQLSIEDMGGIAVAGETDLGPTREDRLRTEQTRTRNYLKQVEGQMTASERMYTFQPVGTDSLRAMLNPSEALISYGTEPTPDGRGSRLVAFVVTRSGVRSRVLPATQQSLTEQVRFFRDQISHPDRHSWEPVSRRLYAELVEPVLPLLPAGIRHLNVVPEGVLHYVPFAALMDRRGHYLVERFTLSVTPSATTLKLCRERNPRQWRSMLLVGDPDGELPGSRREVQHISSRSPNRRLPLIGSRATLANVEELATQYDILHFATHGRFDSRTPWQSRLDLNGNDLDVARIGRLKLDAYLVTLSACETGLSAGVNADIPDGEEWVGLNQAFLAAGTPTVMASLWPISDRVSGRFMTLFYDRLGTTGKAGALAEVQRRFLKDPSTRHPFYWAAFTIIGDPA